MDVDEESIVTKETQQSMTGQILRTEQEYFESCEMPPDLVEEHMYILEQAEPDEPSRTGRRERIVAPWQRPRVTLQEVARFKQGLRDRRNRLRVRTLVQAGRRSTRSRSTRLRARRTAGLPTARSADPPPGPEEPAGASQTPRADLWGAA